MATRVTIDLPKPPKNVSPAGEDAAGGSAVNDPSFSGADFSGPTDPNSMVYRDDTPQSRGTVRFPSDTPLYYTKLGVYDYQRKSWASVGELGSALNTLVLPMPERLADSQSARYNTTPIGASGALAAWALGGSQNIKNAINDFQNASNPENHAANRSAATAVLGRAAASAAGLAGPVGQNISRGAQAALGYSLNDFLTVMYEGPNYKTFEMTWRLSPRSLLESQSIKAMEVILKNAQAPAWADSFELFFRWPRIFMIAFEYYDETTAEMGDRLYRFKPAMLVNSTFNYAPGGVPAFYGASQFPEGVAISLQFTEIELWVNTKDAQDAYGTPFVPGQ